jgi:hypothetical protein
MKFGHISGDQEVGDPTQGFGGTGEGASIPAGLICMWHGLLSAIPAGWVLCDGQNGTPDLRDRFVKGAAAEANPGATGGAATHQHAAHPSHTHNYTQVPNHVHVQRAQGGTSANTSGTHLMTSSATGGSLRDSGQSTQNPTGGVATATTEGPSASLTHDSVNHEPPYYAVAFIMKT